MAAGGRAGTRRVGPACGGVRAAAFCLAGRWLRAEGAVFRRAAVADACGLAEALGLADDFDLAGDFGLAVFGFRDAVFTEAFRVDLFLVFFLVREAVPAGFRRFAAAFSGFLVFAGFAPLRAVRRRFGAFGFRPAVVDARPPRARLVCRLAAMARSCRS